MKFLRLYQYIIFGIAVILQGTQIYSAAMATVEFPLITIQQAYAFGAAKGRVDAELAISNAQEDFLAGLPENPTVPGHILDGFLEELPTLRRNIIRTARLRFVTNDPNEPSREDALRQGYLDGFEDRWATLYQEAYAKTRAERAMDAAAASRIENAATEIPAVVATPEEAYALGVKEGEYHGDNQARIHAPAYGRMGMPEQLTVPEDIRKWVLSLLPATRKAVLAEEGLRFDPAAEAEFRRGYLAGLEESWAGYLDTYAKMQAEGAMAIPAEEVVEEVAATPVAVPHL